MKTNLARAKKLAEAIATELYESGYGNEDQFQGMIEFSQSKIADMIEAHDRDILTEAHARYVEAAKRCGE